MAEILLEPSSLSKIIPLSFDLNDTNASNAAQLMTKRQFNTADTDAWFQISLEGFVDTAGSFDITLFNLNDKSVFNHTGKPFATNPFYYKLDSESDETTNEIRHAGRWIGQIVVTLANGDSATRKFIFDIEGHILDGADVQTILLEDYNALIATINTSKDLLAQYNVDYAALLVDLAAAETARTATYNQLVADQQANIDAFDVALDTGIVAANLANKLQDFETTNNSRLLSTERQLAETNIISSAAVVKADVASQKADAMASGSPKGVYATLASLQAAYPIGAVGAYLVAADGKWYYWNGTVWTIGGVYQSTGIGIGAVKKENIETTLRNRVYDAYKMSILKKLATDNNYTTIVDTSLFFEPSSISGTGVNEAGYETTRFRTADFIPSDVEFVICPSDFQLNVFEYDAAGVFKVYTTWTNNFKITYSADKKYKMSFRKIDGSTVGAYEYGMIAFLKGYDAYHLPQLRTNIATESLFEAGALDGAGANSALYSTTRIRTKTFIDPSINLIYCNAGYKFIVFKYNSSGVYVSTLGTFNLFSAFESGVKYRIVLKKDLDAPIVVSEYINLSLSTGTTLIDTNITKYVDAVSLVDANSFKYKLGVDARGRLSTIDSSGRVLSDTKLLWSDEFTGTSLDMTKWRYVVGKRELEDGTPKQYYPPNQSQNVFIQDGILHLKAIRNNPIAGFEWSAAFVETNNIFEFKYGRIESRIKFSSVAGSYATLWTLGANYDRTQTVDANGFTDETIGVEHSKCGEIDIAEFNSVGSPTIALHYGEPQKSIHGYGYGISGSDWHVYAMEWNEHKIDFFVDGILKKTIDLDLATESDGYNAFRLPHFLMLNSGVAMFGNAPASGINELETLVDYVRVYTPIRETDIINARKITLDKATHTLSVGGTYPLMTTFDPLQTHDKTLTWTSSDNAVAMVYGGKITALRAGVATITATTKNGKTATCLVTVS